MITRDMETAVIVGRILLIVATITTTSFPVLYAFSPWHKRPLGRAFMLEALTVAFAIWLKFILTFFLADGPRTILLWMNVIILGLIIIFTSALTILLWRIRSAAKREVDAFVREHTEFFDNNSATE
jgi:hypothetical protein